MGGIVLDFAGVESPLLFVFQEFSSKPLGPPERFFGAKKAKFNE